MNKKDYDRLKSEYNDGYKKSGPSEKNGVYQTAFIIAAAFTAITAVLTVVIGIYGLPEIEHKKYDKVEEYGALIAVPLTAVICFAFGISEQKRWEQTEQAVKMSAASYDCAVTDCACYYERGKNRATHMVFKFTYIKDGAVITDMCVTSSDGVFKGDLSKTRITLYETRRGEKVIGIILKGKSEHEHRIMC